MTAPARCETAVEVRYAETDQMGVVHHANYIVWFELARTRLCALTGTPYTEVERLGYLLMVIGVEARYRQPARYGDTVRVSCWVASLTPRTVRFAYEVRRDETLLATGTTDHIWVDAASRRPCRVPAALRDPFERLAGAAAATPSPSASPVTYSKAEAGAPPAPPATRKGYPT
jgi:acyl-CoA thioester hydrolase